jgi:hypothetical protein
MWDAADFVAGSAEARARLLVITVMNLRRPGQRAGGARTILLFAVLPVPVVRPMCLQERVKRVRTKLYSICATPLCSFKKTAAAPVFRTVG